MSLITPLFLLGLLGIGLPIWLHRLQTQTNEREKFASSMFLEQTRHRIHVKRKLKYLLLMAMRILFLALLALAFTRPQWDLPPQLLPGDEDTMNLIVIDASFSMQQGDSFTAALDQARDIIDDMDGGDQAAIYTASSSVELVAEPTAETATLIPLLSGLEPDNGRLDIGAMISALNTLVPETEATAVLHFISDYQKSGQPVRFADMVPDVMNDRPISLEFHRVGTVNLPNWAITAVDVEADEATVVVQGTNTEAAEKTVQLFVNDELQGELSSVISANGQQAFYFDGLVFAEGDNRVDVRLTETDNLANDDHRYSVIDNSPPAPVLTLTADPESLALTYISAALSTAPRPYVAEIQPLADLDVRILTRYPWVIIDDIGSVNGSLAEALTEYVNGGGSIFAAMGTRAEALDQVPVGNQAITDTINTGQSRRIITSIDSSHPALSAESGWATVNITHALPVEPAADDTVLMALNDNIPLLIEQQQGLGTFMLLNSALDNTWTDLPLKPVFVGFMAEMARYLSGEDILQREQVVDSFLQLQTSGGNSGQVYDPQGNTMLSLEDTASAREVSLSELGYYRIVTANGESLVAVNPDLRESDLTLMEASTLQNWQNAVAGRPVNQAESIPASAAVNSEENEVFEFWRVLLVLLVAIVVIESLFGNRHLRFQTDTQPGPASNQPEGLPTGSAS